MRQYNIYNPKANNKALDVLSVTLVRQINWLSMEKVEKDDRHALGCHVEGFRTCFWISGKTGCSTPIRQLYYSSVDINHNDPVKIYYRSCFVVQRDNFSAAILSILPQRLSDYPRICDIFFIVVLLLLILVLVVVDVSSSSACINEIYCPGFYQRTKALLLS